MSALLAFHGDQAVKDKYIARVNHHIFADNLVRQKTWEDGKGCAIGCTLEAYDHSLYPIELGIPEWLARVEDTLFEGMSVEKSRTWPRDFLQSITPSADLDAIRPRFMIMILQSSLDAQENNTNFDADAFPDVAAAIDLSKKSLREMIDLWSAAWSAARSAASAAWSAAHDRYADALLVMLADAPLVG